MGDLPLEAHAALVLAAIQRAPLPRLDTAVGKGDPDPEQGRTVLGEKLLNPNVCTTTKLHTSGNLGS
jgi:hypothetical protein